MSEEGKTEDKKERRFSQEQYDMLKRCSDRKDMREWNEWRWKNIDKGIFLEGANLYRCYLKGALLSEAVVKSDSGKIYVFEKETSLDDPLLDGVNYNNFNKKVCLKEANFCEADLGCANLHRANLKDANLYGAYLENADIRTSCLKGANLRGADLRGANLRKANLEGAQCRMVITNGFTLLRRCEVDQHTDFRGVGLDSCRIDSGMKQILKYNIRRKNWEEWYKEHRFWRWPVQAFWAMSDYGMSTLRVIGVFLILALLFAAVYMNWAYWSPPGIIYDLSVEPVVGEAGWHYLTRAVIRPVYFSVVTMTTLGFGDMYANKGSIAGHVLLILQVILGYVLLGALITRFAVLFTAGGPAGTFVKEKKE